MSQDKKFKVLLEAYFCNPGQQSVSLIGYKWFRDLQELADVTLLTHIRNKKDLDPEVKGGTQVLYIDLQKISSALWKLRQKCPPFLKSFGEVLFGLLDYQLFASAAKKKIAAVGKERFDLYHRVTPVTAIHRASIPSLGIPSLIGPLNYGMEWPEGFAASKYATKVGQGVFYGLVSRMTRALIGASFRNYKKILVASKLTQQAVPQRFQDRCVRFVENGVDVGDFTFKVHERDVVKCLYVGRLIPFKAVDILMEGFQKALAKDRRLRLTLLGDGEERRELEKFAGELGLSEFCQFKGNVPNRETIGYFQDADIFLFSSLRESGGAVALEAMSCGTVPIVVDHAGPSEIVTDAVGIKIKPVSREQLVDDFAKATLKLANDTALRHRMAHAGRRMVEEEYDWKARARRMVDLYRETCR